MIKLISCFNKILGTRPKMAGAGGVGLVPVDVFVIPLTRHFVSTYPARGEVNGLLRFTRNDDRVIGEIDRLLCGACNDDRARGGVI